MSLHHFEHTVKTLPAMDNHGKAEFRSYRQLPVECLHLLPLECLVPVQVDTDLADSAVTPGSNILLYEGKLCLPVFFDLCRVKAHGHNGVVGARRVQSLQRRHTCPVDIGENHHIHSGGNSPVDSGALAFEGTFHLPVDIILGHIQMRVRVDHQ